MLSRVSHILPLTIIRRARQLPCSGKIIARSGQKVAANDVIAEATLPSRHLMLDIERGLGLPADKADELVQSQPGDLVQEGEVLAGPVGIMSRIVRAPQAGRVVAVRGGRVLLELETTTINVRAGFAATVAELIPDRGAYIEAIGSLVQGFWGNGRIDAGMILMAVKKPEEEMTPDKLDVSMRGAVIVCGSCNRPEVLQAAADMKLRALIFSSISSNLVGAAMQAPMPVMVLEGFGKLPYSAQVFKVLSTSEKREGSINTTGWDRWKGSRPELVVGLPVSNRPPLPRELDIIAPGQAVRVMQPNMKGRTATVSSLQLDPVVMPSGLRVEAALVKFENGDAATIPLANLEVIG